MIVITGSVLVVLVLAYVFYLHAKRKGAEEEIKNNLKEQMKDVARAIKIKNKCKKETAKKIKEKMKKYIRD